MHLADHLVNRYTGKLGTFYSRYAGTRTVHRGKILIFYSTRYVICFIGNLVTYPASSLVIYGIYSNISFTVKLGTFYSWYVI